MRMSRSWSGKGLDFLPLMVLRPLDYLPGKPLVRLVIEGFNQIPQGTDQAVRKALGARPSHVRLVLTDTPRHARVPTGYTLQYDRADRAAVVRYLNSRRVLGSFPLRDPRPGRGSLADRPPAGRRRPRRPRARPRQACRKPSTRHTRSCSTRPAPVASDAWRTRFASVLGPLAVAGAGPILPLALLVHASKSLGGTGEPSRGPGRPHGPPRPRLASRQRRVRRTRRPLSPYSGPSTSSAFRPAPSASRLKPGMPTGLWRKRLTPLPGRPHMIRMPLSIDTLFSAKSTIGGPSRSSVGLCSV